MKDKSETNGVNVRTNVGRQERKKKNKIDIDIE